MPQGNIQILINGIEGQSLDVADRGLAYGDGLFETIAVRDGKPMLWKEHLLRLSQGFNRLGFPPLDTELLLCELTQLSANSDGVAKLTITRGSGPRGYAPPKSPMLTRIVQFTSKPSVIPAYLAEGVESLFCKTPLAINPLLAGLKHLNRLEQVLARGEWRDEAVYEGIMCDTEGYVVEGTCSNLFLVSNGQLFTPTIDRCGIAGVMRASILEAAHDLGITAQEVRIEKERIKEAEAVFLTNSLWGMVPVNRIDDMVFDPGVIDQRLVEAVWKKSFGGTL